ncbi:hypothetical protein NECAME_13987 [Necator americanus]|uniref:Uncharacterized protein n=1 Tax=Necator americanus TaxID=51031 RepID=W2SQU2_NECAM|nr:hypothetical protein NECAME_13987 [Necator americanus]ETN72109.1 hypothetical protein NECAME_13987 [Necator americanus]
MLFTQDFWFFISCPCAVRGRDLFGSFRQVDNRESSQFSPAYYSSFLSPFASSAGSHSYSRQHVPVVFLQLEVIGGPQPTPQIEFTLNNSKIATIEPNALITSKKLGYTSITGTVDIGGQHSSQVFLSFA